MCDDDHVGPGRRHDARPQRRRAAAPQPGCAVARSQQSARLALRPFGIAQLAIGETITTAELRILVDEAERVGAIPRAQEELLHAVFEFADREAADGMVPAPEVTWLDAKLTAAEALDSTQTRFRWLAARWTASVEVAGLVLDRLVRLPIVGDIATVDDVQLRDHATEGPRITALRVTLPQQLARSRPGE